MKKLTTTFLNEVIQQETENQIQARPNERTGKRKAHRIGTRPRKLKTIHGEIELEKPQIREFPFKTTVFETYSRVEESVRVAVAEFLNRPIEGPIPYLLLDASYFKVQDDGRYVNKALLIVTGIHKDGYREILSAEVADSEDASCWENCFESLKARGLTGVKLVTSDGHKGIQTAVQKEFL